MLYMIQATVVVHSVDANGRKYETTRQIPTFYLNADIQGIRDIDHAVEVAHRVINPAENPDLVVMAYATSQFPG